MGVTRFGAYTTHLNVDARYVIALPQGWSLPKVLLFPCKYLRPIMP
jgi:NADPH:quinone reductase-like Zn-dependent oxidoreductase